MSFPSATDRYSIEEVLNRSENHIISEDHRRIIITIIWFITSVFCGCLLTNITAVVLSGAVTAVLTFCLPGYILYMRNVKGQTSVDYMLLYSGVIFMVMGVLMSILVTVQNGYNYYEMTEEGIYMRQSNITSCYNY